MTILQVYEKFVSNPKYVDKGAGYLAKQFRCTKEDIYEAKGMYRENLNKKIEILEDEISRYIGSEKNQDSEIKKFETSRPLTPKEIEELAGVDGITSEVARVWDKLQPNGMWTYSIDIRYKIKDFYNYEELKKKIEEIFPDQTPYTLPKGYDYKDEALVILLADDHVGAVNTTNLFKKNKLDYSERLTLIAQEAINLANGKKFDHVFIISLGDQLNGWNSQTTRGGHKVASLPNKEQFDIYTRERKKFYDRIFSSHVGKDYTVIDVENSNHSGNGMSYMANSLLETYLEAKYPEVIRVSTHEAMDGFEYGEHVILVGHGKDEEFMKRPMPAVLNAQTDLSIQDFALSKGISSYEKNITFYKGDLHQLGIQMGKFGRYINVQSIAGNSDYGDLNFGNTRGGALLEIYDKNSYRISTQSIWF